MRYYDSGAGIGVGTGVGVGVGTELGVDVGSTPQQGLDRSGVDIGGPDGMGSTQYWKGYNRVKGMSELPTGDGRFQAGNSYSYFI
jgi:hypothetical protein